MRKGRSDRPWAVTTQVFTIGRAEGSDLRLLERTVSADHATIQFSSGSYWLEDVKSRNNTLLNGQPIRGLGPQRLNPDDSILIEGHEFRFLDDRTYDTRVSVMDFDLDNVAIRVNGREVRLTRHEVQFMQAVAKRPGNVTPKEEIFRKVWPKEVAAGGDLDDLDDRLYQLVRKLLERAKADPRHISRVRGHGFRFEPRVV